MSGEGISAIAGVILSLMFSYVPGLNVKFAALQPEVKRLIMLGLLFLVSTGAFGLACAGAGELVGIAVVCDQSGAASLVRAFLAAVIANQSAYMISPKPKSIRYA